MDNNRIEKELKHVTFTYEDKMLTIAGRSAVALTRVEMFSLARFILRIAQKKK